MPVLHYGFHSTRAVQAEKLEEKLFAANTEVSGLQKARRHNRCVCAFVTFMDAKSRARCIAANPNTIGELVWVQIQELSSSSHSNDLC